MDSPGRATRHAELPAAAQAVLAAAAKGKRAPVYLLYGEPYLVSRAAHALVDVLLPREWRSLSLEVYDGRTAALAAVIDSARTPGFLGGTKVLWVRDLPCLGSLEQRADSVAGICEAAASSQMDRAANSLLALLARAGWSQGDFETRRLSETPRRTLEAAFGTKLQDTQLQALDEVQSWARERGMQIAVAADAEAQLLSLLERGLPPGVILLLTAEYVDAGRRVVKKLIECGAALELTLERERSGALGAQSAARIVEAIAAAYNKRLAPAARARLLQKAGTDPAALASEAEKLCLYAGDEPVLTAADVDAVVRDLGEAWIFDLTNALGNREAQRAIAVLRGLLREGTHPLQVLAALHTHLRLLLALRDCLDGPWRGRWRAGMNPEALRTRLLPLLPDEERAFLASVHPYRLLLGANCAARWEAHRLRQAVRELALLDLKFKSSRGDPAILLEAFVLNTCIP